ncbi:hypothetical protein OPT61_g773 [Boeremia exigua]|uniref:Uncharacterized protein n=1 Tax=Boeremia exigua TaxID=749465 RepID=A0ACC2ISQ7_9PLEO|nr:hypothetical protein OPT61_g773 [Boeremia exigua]
MLSNSMLAVLATMSLVAATPVDYTLQARGNTPSKPADIKCSGEIIGYRTVTTKVRQALLVDILEFSVDLADKVNTAKAFPHVQPNGSDLGNGAVYFSDGFGDYPGGGSGVHWCVAYADSTKLKDADKVWFTEDPRLKQCTRFSDSNVDAYIGMMSGNKFSPASTLRFAKMDTYLQVAIPFAMLNKMKVCGRCFPKTEAETIKSQYPRINWKQGPYKGSNVKQRRDDLDARAPAACPMKTIAKPSPSPSAPSKPKATPTPKASKPLVPKPKVVKPKASKPKVRAAL